MSDRAYFIAYERERRARCRRTGRCVQCGTARRRKGRRQNGEPFRRCQRCIDRGNRFTARSLRLRLRRGVCRSCPRKRERGDRHQECVRCRQIRNRGQRDKRRARRNAA